MELKRKIKINEEEIMKIRKKNKRKGTKEKDIFWECLGRIRCYEHKFVVKDKIPYCLRGWLILLSFQKQVDLEVRTMEEYRIIERIKSAYINLLVTVIKKDGRVRTNSNQQNIRLVRANVFYVYYQSEVWFLANTTSEEL